jgi:hypothetical protein
LPPFANLIERLDPRKSVKSARIVSQGIPHEPIICYDDPGSRDEGAPPGRPSPSALGARSRKKKGSFQGMCSKETKMMHRSRIAALLAALAVALLSTAASGADRMVLGEEFTAIG